MGTGAQRDLLYLLVRREIRVRYARTVLGVAWAALMPVAMMLVFTGLRFERLMEDGSPYKKLPYAVFALCGLVPWTYFASTLAAATGSLVASRDLLKKSAFRHETIPLSRILAGLLDLAIGVAVLAILIALEGPPGVLRSSLLAVPVILVLQIAFTAGLALLLSAANFFFRDVQYILQVGLLLLMFASAVVYPLEGISPAARDILAMNPLTSFMNAYREAVMLGRWPGVSLLPGLVGAVLAVGIGYPVFRRLSPRFPEEA